MLLDDRATLLARPPARRRLVREAHFASAAAALPQTAVGNAEVAERVGVDAAWISRRTGVHERRRLQPGESLDELACVAGERAVAAAGADPGEIDLVVVATSSAEDIAPGCGPRVAARVGAAGAGIDINSSCTGFLAAAGLAAAAIESGRARSVLVVGADAPSRFVDAGDRDTAPLFGDGAGAVVLRGGAGESRVGPMVMRSDGSGRGLVRVTRDDPVVRMRGGETYRRAVAALTDATREAVAASGRRLEDVDLFALHQANGRILSAVADRLGQPAERFINSVGSYGNTCAASIPISLAQAIDDGRLRDGAVVLIGACGAGFTFGATTVEWGSPERGGDLVNV